MGAQPSRRRTFPDRNDLHRRCARIYATGTTRRSEVLRAVDDGDGDVAGRHCTAGAGRAAQPYGEEVRAAGPLRKGGHFCAPGLRWHDDHGERRHLQSRSAGGLVPGAQETERHPNGDARRRHRPCLQRRVWRRLQPALCGQGRRHWPSRTLGHLRRRQAAAAESSDGQEGGCPRQAGRTYLRGVLASAARRARHHARGDCRKPEKPERRRARRLHRHPWGSCTRARERSVRQRRRHPQRADRRRWQGDQAR